LKEVSPVLSRRRDFLQADGPDAARYLQGQLSQDIEALGVGASVDSFLLQPAGKVDAWLRVTHLDLDRFVLDMDAGWGEVVTRRLHRFLMRTRCTIAPLGWGMATVLGSQSVAAPPDGLAIDVRWPHLSATDLMGPEMEQGSGDEVWEVERIRAGIPAMGSDIDTSTIPAATGLVDRTVSFTKGCFTGQELVARIDSRSAGAPTRLVRARGSGGPVPEAGAHIEVSGARHGHLTSIAATDNGFVALGYLHRNIEVPATCEVAWAGERQFLEILAD
jgi:tRNA-modifying protein YgfZ